MSGVRTKPFTSRAMTSYDGVEDAIHSRCGNGGRVTTKIQDDVVRMMLGTKLWPSNGGSCVAAAPDHQLKFDPFTPRDVITDWWSATPFHTRVANVLCGGIVGLAGIGFGLSLDSKMRRYPALLRSANPLRRTIRQPAHMAWRLDGVEKRIEFEWSDNGPRKNITYTLHHGD